ncbi:hypothetical protein GF378_02440 [Candidatus Pacearchaeota archaeon]|nr:hypothetical protein [Candidatus Pacearchaeota archaeon]
MNLYNKIADEINEEENYEREITRHLIRDCFLITPKEYFNAVTSIKSKQEDNIDLNVLEKKLLRFDSDEMLRPYLLDLKASFRVRDK